MAQKLDTELQSTCKTTFTEDAYKRLWDDYTGNWSHNHVAPSDNAMWVTLAQWINQERANGGSKAVAWDKFRNRDDDDESGTLHIIKLVANSSQPSAPLHRVLDFGCGDGVELSKIAKGLGLGRKDTYCLDIIDYVAKEAKPHVTTLVVPNTPEEYGPALQSHQDDHGLQGSVSVVFSQVTFHHITNPEMRVAALKFIHDSLSHDGLFLLAEWDDSGHPIDYTIYFDLAHFLPNLFFADPAPTTAALSPLDTGYLSLQGWNDMFKSNGLPFDASRSRLPWRTSENGTVWMGPDEVVDKASGRNFLAVYGKEK
jgi:SAM-dependent methyltransferase